MASPFDWIKLILEQHKAIAAIILLLISFGGYTVNDNLAKTEEIHEIKRQLAEITELRQKQSKTENPNKTPAKTEKATIIKQCGGCKSVIRRHEEEFH